MSGERTEHISLGIVKRVRSATTPEGTELRVEFWNRGLLVVRATFGEPLAIDLTPASLAQLVPPSYYREDPRLYDAAREACHACGLPWTDPRTGITYEPPPLTDAVVDAFLAAEPPADPDRVAQIRERFEVRRATHAAEQYEAVLRKVQQEIHEGTASHECSEWRRGLLCEVCGQWLGEIPDPGAVGEP